MTVDCSFCSVPNCKSRGLTSAPTECIFVHKNSQTVAKMDYNMSKIEEMAHRDLPVKSRVVCGVTFDKNEAERIGYMLGAKAILEEIEKFIAELPCKSDRELLNQKMLWQRIKQLKEK